VDPERNLKLPGDLEERDLLHHKGFRSKTLYHFGTIISPYKMTRKREQLPSMSYSCVN